MSKSANIYTYPGAPTDTKEVVMFATKLLAGITEMEHGNILAKWCRMVDIKSGQPIVVREDTGNDLFILMEGEAEAHVTSDFRAPLKAGDVFGEMSFTDRAPRSALVKAVTDVTVSTLSWEDFERISVEDPQLALLIMTNINRTVTANLRRTDEEVRSLTHAVRTGSSELQRALEKEAPGWFQRLSAAWSS